MAEQSPPLVHNKIGFHIGPYTNNQLLQDWLYSLDSQNIPVFLTVTGDFHFLFNLVGRLTLPQNHTIVYQFRPEQMEGFEKDLFDFNNASFYQQNQGQEAALAEKYWEQIQYLLPSDFPREKVWLELPGNLTAIYETMQADWLGEFATALARRTTEIGYKIAFFGWRNGEPSIEAWETNGMLRLLHYCQQFPDNLGVSLHEFSGSLDTISPDTAENEIGTLSLAPPDGERSGIGRFRQLVQVCHEQDITVPPIFISEWGWTRERIPNPGAAMEHIVQVNEQLYSNYPEIRGAALWTLDPDAGAVADSVADLVRPLTELSLSYQFEIHPQNGDWSANSYGTDPFVEEYDEDPSFEEVSQPIREEDMGYTRLRSVMADFFNEEELRSLCFNLGVDYENLPASGKENKVRELISLILTQRRSEELMAELIRQRPEIGWQEIVSGQLSPPGLDYGRIRTLPAVINERFDEAELRSLCFELDVDYENLPAVGKADKVRELVSYFARRQRIPDLALALQRMRPNGFWEEWLETDTAVSTSSSPPPQTDYLPLESETLPELTTQQTAVADFITQTEAPAIKGAFPIPTNMGESIESQITVTQEARPFRAWLAPFSGEDDAGFKTMLAEDEPSWQTNADAGAEDIVALYRLAPHNELTHLFTVQSRPDAESPFRLRKAHPLNRSLPEAEIATHPAMQGWKPPTTADQPLDLTAVNLWQPLRSLIAAWNPDLIADLAEWEGLTEEDVWQTAVTIALQIPDKNGRLHTLISLIQKRPSTITNDDLLKQFNLESEWRARRAVWNTLQRPIPPTMTLDDATAILRKHGYTDAKELLQKIDTSWESIEDPQLRARGHALLAQTYEGLGDNKKALTQWRKAAELDPANSATFEGIERCTPDNQLDRSAQFIEKVAAKAPDSAGPTVGMAAIAQRRNEYEKAAELLETAVHLTQDHVEKQRIETRREVIVQYIPQTAVPPETALHPTLDPREKSLIEFLIRHGGKEEIRQLCADLGIDDEELREDGLSRMAREFVRRVGKAGRLAELETLVRQNHPRQAFVFQESVQELIENAQALLPHNPAQVIEYLRQQKQEWEIGTAPERAAIHSILAQAFAATGNHRMAYAHWQNQARLQPNAANAFNGMAAAAQQLGADMLDKAETWMQQFKQQNPTATGPAIGLAAIAQLRGDLTKAAERLTNAPAASLVQQAQMAQAAQQLLAAKQAPPPADDAAQDDDTAVPPPPTFDPTHLATQPNGELVSNRLSRTLNDLSSTTTGLDDNAQVQILREFVQQTLALPTLSAAHKQDLRLRSARVLAEATRTQRVTPEMTTELRLPVLDSLFITQPQQRRALIRTVSSYRQSAGRRLALFLRDQARRQIRKDLGAKKVAVLVDDSTAETAVQEEYDRVKTAVFSEGSFHLQNQTLQTLSDICKSKDEQPVGKWRTAVAKKTLTLTGNLNHDVLALDFSRYDTDPRQFWLLLHALLHSIEGHLAHLDSWERFRRSPLPDSISSILLAAFHPETHLPYKKRRAEQMLRNLELDDKETQLDYRTYMEFAHNLLHDPDLGFDDLDDVGLFLYQMSGNLLSFAPDPGAEMDGRFTLHPPLAREVMLKPAHIDTALTLPDSAFDQITSALNAGNHIILIGPPGTGKTTVAQDISRLAHDTNCNRGFISVTATADWTTFDTIGGYMPTTDNRLAFSEGIVLRAIREKKWLIIDEINRAEIDKAFGEMFTVLSGQPVTLPYRDGHHPIRILPPGYPAQSEKDYVIPQTWRVIGTMNVYDKASLFEMSYAFMRRFAFVDVGIPDKDTFPQLISLFLRQVDLADDDENAIAQALRDKLFHHQSKVMHHRPLGPAIARDMIRYMARRCEQTGAATPDHVAEAFLLYAVPQFDGLEEHKIVDVVNELKDIFTPAAKTTQAIFHRLEELFPQYPLLKKMKEEEGETAVSDTTSTENKPDSGQE
ncbi:MAG: AAA family ATPase [Ardenticatenaceae bacterium]|nr:AAA family ATPase [Ardenticatenaceae bacterium]